MNFKVNFEELEKAQDTSVKGPSKMLSPGVHKVTLCNPSISDAGKGWLKIICEAVEPTEGLNNPKQPCGNTNYQYCETSFSLSPNVLVLNGNINPAAFLGNIAMTLGMQEEWDSATNEEMSNEELLEAIDMLCGKEILLAIGGDIETMEDGGIWTRPRIAKERKLIMADPSGEKAEVLIKYVKDQVEKGEWVKSAVIEEEKIVKEEVFPEY